MNTYTDPKFLDVAGAMEALPSLPLGDGKQTVANVLSATGTDDLTASQFAPKFAPTTAKPSTLQSIVDKIASAGEKLSDAEAVDVSACPVKQNSPLTTTVNGLHLVGGTGLEPVTPSLSSNGTHDASENRQGLTPTDSDACTNACTSEGENVNADAFDDASLGTFPMAADDKQSNTSEVTAAIDRDHLLAKLAADLNKLSAEDWQQLAAMLK